MPQFAQGKVEGLTCYLRTKWKNSLVSIGKGGSFPLFSQEMVNSFPTDFHRTCSAEWRTLYEISFGVGLLLIPGMLNWNFLLNTVDKVL